MLPLKDRNPTRRTPVVTYALIALNIVAFVYELSLGERLAGFFDAFGVIPRDVTGLLEGRGFSVGVAGTLVTSMFLHGGWLHLGGNMLYLWVFGDNIEDKMGPGRFLLFYLLTGIMASLLHVAVAPYSIVPTVGASGAISGVLGGYLVLFPRARVLTLIPVFVFLHLTELPAVFVIGLWFVLQFFNGLVSLGVDTAGMGGVAWWAHIGGFVAGVLLVVPFRRYR